MSWSTAAALADGGDGDVDVDDGGNYDAETNQLQHRCF